SRRGRAPSGPQEAVRAREAALPRQADLSGAVPHAAGGDPRTVATVTENEAAALAELRALREGLTLAECGARLGIRRERASQNERQALAKLRRLARREPLEQALERAHATTREKD